MPRKRSGRRLVVPEADRAMERFKANVMHSEGYNVNPDQPETVNVEVARSLGVPLKRGYNGGIRAAEAGKVGGKIGGSMVREMIRMAQQHLVKEDSKP
jgi:small acid-soluble spore protein D (minor alpha/beta-type SASP)